MRLQYFFMNPHSITQSSLIVENKHIICGMIGDDKFYVYHVPGTLSTKDDIHFIFEHYRELTSTRGPLKLIVFVTENASMNKEAEDHLKSLKQIFICEAIVTSGIAQRILVGFYFRLSNRPHPTKAFRNFDNALAWVDANIENVL